MFTALRHALTLLVCLQSVLVMMCMLAMMLYTLYGDLMYMSVFPLAMIGFDIVIFMIRAPSGARAYQEFLKQEK